MRVRFLSAAVAAGAITLSLAGCGNSDSPVSPRQSAPAPTAPASHLLLSSPQTVTPLLRTTPLASSITVSKTIGVLGGTLAIPQAGVTIVVPALAVSSPTQFSVTAQAGANVAYEFEPHGTRFSTPLVMTQDLRVTQARAGGPVNPLALYGGYFADSSQPTLVSELLNLNVNLLSQVGVMSLWHFSGYIVAVGAEDGA
jgi:hypothetical protein